jgi:hypothetical protein
MAGLLVIIIGRCYEISSAIARSNWRKFTEVSPESYMAEPKVQTVSGTMPAIARDGLDVVFNWEAKATVQDGKQTVHVHAWATDSDNRPVQVYQFYGAIISPELGDQGHFASRVNISDYEADVVTFDVPEATDVALQVGMYLSAERDRDQDISDTGDINFPVAA